MNSDIKAKVLPSNVTAICQSMDYSVLETTNKKYLQHHLRSLISAIDNNEGYITTLKKTDI